MQKPEPLRNRCDDSSLVSLFLASGPPPSFSAVHRFAASSHLAGPPTPILSVGPTAQFQCGTPLRGLLTSGRSPHAEVELISRLARSVPNCSCSRSDQHAGK